MRCSSTLTLVLFFLFSGGSNAMDAKVAKEVGQVLDQFHLAASKADGATYFGLFAPEGIFLGTDASERWTVEEFRAYAMPHFSKGKGWTYVSSARHIDGPPFHDVAWFDEMLDNTALGVCRGTGVLRKVNGTWKISQYHLTIPVPNDLVKPFVEMIRKVGKK